MRRTSPDGVCRIFPRGRATRVISDALPRFVFTWVTGELREVEEHTAIGSLMLKDGILGPTVSTGVETIGSHSY